MKRLNLQKLMAECFIILSLILSYASYQGLAAQGKEQGSIEETEYAKKYNFSRDWFTHNIPLWKKTLLYFKGKPNIHYLEIGVYEGRSLIWMLENILTHSSSKVTCIDVFPRDLKERFLANLEISGVADKVTIIKGRSQIELRSCLLNSFDIIYIDGSHHANDVLADAVLSWPLLKTDGVLIFDDYLLWHERPIELRPKFAIDAFITAYRNRIEEVHHEGNQVILRKRKRSQGFPIRIGQYVYSWKQKKLYAPGKSEPIELSDTETVLIDRLIKSRKSGEIKSSPGNEMFANEEFMNLIKRIKPDFGDGEKP